MVTFLKRIKIFGSDLSIVDHNSKNRQLKFLKQTRRAWFLVLNMSILNILEIIILWYQWLLDFQFFFFEFVLAKNRHPHSTFLKYQRFQASNIFNHNVIHKILRPFFIYTLIPCVSSMVSGIILNQVEPKIIKVVFLAPAWHASEELYGYDSIDVT